MSGVGVSGWGWPQGGEEGDWDTAAGLPDGVRGRAVGGVGGVRPWQRGGQGRVQLDVCV